MSNRVIGFQIAAQDEERLKRFYHEAFAWEFSPGPHDHVSATPAAGGTPGDIIGRGEYIPDYVGLYIEVDDLEATLERCCLKGAKVIRPTFALPNGDRLAIVADPEEHTLILIKKSGRT